MLEASPVKLKENLSFEVQPVIVDQKLKELRNKLIPMVKNFMEK